MDQRQRGRSRERSAPSLPLCRHLIETPPTPSTPFPLQSCTDDTNHLPIPDQHDNQARATLQSYLATPPNEELSQEMGAHMSMRDNLLDESYSSFMDLSFPRRSSSAARSETSMHSVGSVANCASYRSVDPRGSRRGRRNWNAAIAAPPVPKFERTHADVAADSFFNPSAVTQSIQQTDPAQASLLSPGCSDIGDNVQRAL